MPYDLIFSDNVSSQILSVGPNFKYASNFLWPFKLNTPSGGWRKKVNHFVEGESFSIFFDSYDVYYLTPLVIENYATYPLTPLRIFSKITFLAT